MTAPKIQANSDWRPTATRAALAARAEILHEIRRFFRNRGVLEVETPYLSRAAVTDPHLFSFETEGSAGRFFLQTSPEYAMKRLLAADSGAIFQIARCFRDQERGSRHNPEFTLLEWYQPGFDHHQLMEEVFELIDEILGPRLPNRLSVQKLTYREAFDFLGFDPHTADIETMKQSVGDRWPSGVEVCDRDEALSLLLTHLVEPTFAPHTVTFLHDFPASQAALAQLRSEATDDRGSVDVAERFEAYVVAETDAGEQHARQVTVYELANGFHELRDSQEQRRRFETDLEWRRKRGLSEPEIDERLLAALEAGLPHCSGVALGIDRLVMLALGARSIDQVLTFPIERA